MWVSGCDVDFCCGWLSGLLLLGIVFDGVRLDCCENVLEIVVLCDFVDW